MRSREDVDVGDCAVTVGELVGHDHADASGSFHLGTFGKPRDAVATVTEHDLALDVEAVQRAVAAELGVGCRAGTRVDQRVEDGRRDFWLVQRLPVKREAVTETHLGTDQTVHGARRDGEHPRRVVDQRAGIWTAVAS